jgi:hypothetical protein
LIPHDGDAPEEEDKTKMVHISVIEARMAKLNLRISRWFKPEIRELQHILMDNEEIIAGAQGRYFGGFALLVATDRRLLLIDKKIPYLSVEDVRYDMISEINYSARLYDATIGIFTVNKQHKFTSIKHRHHLRTITSYAQKRIMELRQYQQQGPTTEIIPAPNRAPSLIQAYNYDQRLQLQPPRIPAAMRTKLPSPHLPRIIGAAAVNGTRRWVNPNPYAGGSLVMRKQWSHQ